MGRVNRFPLGYLDLLGAVSQGKTPPDSSEILVPVVDATEFYAADSLGGYTLNPNHAASGSSFTFDHSQDEVWVLRGVAVQSVNLPAAALEQWELGLISVPKTAAGSVDPVSSPGIWASDILTNTAVGDDLTFATLFPAPFIVPPDVNAVLTITQRDGGVARTSNATLLLSILGR